MFQSEQIIFKKMNKLPLAKRLEVAKSPAGKSILGSLSPSELADLFPKYYQQRLPDISGFQKAITQTAREQQAEASQGILDRIMKTEKGLEQYVGEKYHEVKRKLGFEPKAPAGLTPEQEAAWGKIVTGPLDVNSVDGKLFGRLTSQQLDGLGIKKTKDSTGRDVFQYTPPQITRDEAERALRTSGGSGAGVSQRIAYYRQYAKSIGVDPDLVTGIALQEGAEGKDKGPWANPDHFRSGGYAGMAYGDFQFNVRPSGMKGALGNQLMKDLGVDEKFMADKANWKVLGKYAIDRMKRSGTGDWMSVEDTGGIGRITSVGSDWWKKHPGVADIGEKPEGPNNTYSDDQINRMMDQLSKETTTVRKNQLANLLADAGVDTATINSISTVATSGVAGEHFGESKHCVALTKHFCPNIGPASSWKFHDDTSGIVPGAAIATTRYSDGSGGRMASQMPDGKSHYHTGIALTKPDAEGNVLIFDQSKGKGSAITKININDYHGEKWRPIVGGGPTDRSLAAVNMALGRANESEKAAITESLRGKAPTAPTSTPEIKPVVDTAPPPQVPVNQEGQPIAPQAGPPGPAGPRGAPGPSATVLPPAPEVKQKPAPLPNKYRVDQAGLIAAIKNTDEFKNTFGSSLATDSMILEGFASDARVTAAGVSYDPSTGIMKFKDPNDPRVKEALAGLDSKKFMTPIEEKKKEEPKPKVEAPPPKPTPVPEKKPEAPKPTPAAAPAPTPQSPTPQSPAPQPEAKPVPTVPAVPGASNGGTFGTGGDVSFYPMDKRDNIAAVDTKTQQPLFTARGGERIDVTPAQKVQGNMTAPDSGMRNEFDALRQEMGSNFGTAGEAPKPVMQQVNKQQNPDAMPVFTGKLNEQNRSNLYHNPAFERAMMRTRLQETGDQLNGHFSNGNTNY